MEIILPIIPADLGECSLEYALEELDVKDKSKVVLLVSNSYNFIHLFKLAKKFNLNYYKIDSTSVLEEGSWMVINYKNKKIFYCEGP
jgi:hypothetical protein